MARNGDKIFDADTHVRPDAELLEPYLPEAERAKLGDFERYRSVNKEGASTYLIGERSYKRRLGSAGDAAPAKKEYMGGYKRHQHGKPIAIDSPARKPNDSSNPCSCGRDPSARPRCHLPNIAVW